MGVTVVDRKDTLSCEELAIQAQGAHQAVTALLDALVASDNGHVEAGAAFFEHMHVTLKEPDGASAAGVAGGARAALEFLRRAVDLGGHLPDACSDALMVLEKVLPSERYLREMGRSGAHEMVERVSDDERFAQVPCSLLEYSATACLLCLQDEGSTRRSSGPSDSVGARFPPCRAVSSTTGRSAQLGSLPGP